MLKFLTQIHNAMKSFVSAHVLDLASLDFIYLLMFMFRHVQIFLLLNVTLISRENTFHVFFSILSQQWKYSSVMINFSSFRFRFRTESNLSSCFAVFWDNYEQDSVRIFAARGAWCLQYFKRIDLRFSEFSASIGE